MVGGSTREVALRLEAGRPVVDLLAGFRLRSSVGAKARPGSLEGQSQKSRLIVIPSIGDIVNACFGCTSL